MPDPQTQNVTRVDFEITVPVYQSASLQVHLRWGEFDIAASWLGDEYWMATAEFPADTEHLLIVSYLDKNGAITLGSYEANFKTQSNAYELFSIESNDFVTQTWDTDMDGFSNLTESRSGTDPLVKDTIVLEIRDSLDYKLTPARLEFLEHLIPEDRPFTERIVDQQPPQAEFSSDRTITTTEIAFDESGAGSFSYVRDFRDSNDDQLIEIFTDRTNTDGSITWEGTYSLSSFSAALWENERFKIEIAGLTNGTRVQESEIEFSVRRGGTDVFTTTSSLTGKLIEGTSLCQPTSGFLASAAYYDRSPTTDDPSSTFSATKSLDDNYWIVTEQWLDPLVVEQYWVESIATFYCVLKDQ